MALRSLAVLMMVVALAACGTNGEERTGAAATDTSMDAMAGHDMGAMTMDSTLMERHAAEADTMRIELRAHVDRMRELSPADWHAQMDRHAPLVARMLSMMERHMRDMGMGMNMDAAHMAEMMGMSAEEHGAMLRDMEALRSELERLQTASRAEVETLMPPHLERLERLLEMMETGAHHHTGSM